MEVFKCSKCGMLLGDELSLIDSMKLHPCLSKSETVFLINGFVYDKQINEVQKEKFDDEELEIEKKFDKWSDESIKILIHIYKEMNYKFDSIQYSNKQVWREISERLETYGESKSAEKCAEKWRNLKKKYIKIKKHNEGTGNDKKDWVHWDDLHTIFFKNPTVNPILTVSSTGLVKQREENTPKAGSSAAEGSPKQKTGTKRKITNEDATERRHKEKMEQKERMFREFMERFFKDEQK